METMTYCAAMIDAETGGNETYTFDAQADLMEISAPDIIDAFIKHLGDTGNYPSIMSCHLDSAVKKKDRNIVMATGSLMLSKGEIPFLVMVSPKIRD